MKEIWKDVRGYEGRYKVSNHGRVMNIGTLNKTDSRGRSGKRKPKVLKNRKRKDGYLISFNNNFVHRLVAIAFLPNKQNKPEVNHIDGNKHNNNVSNLEWCTTSENRLHAYRNGLMVKSPEQSSKLCRKDVDEIRDLYKNKSYTQKQIGELYKIQPQTVSKIINYYIWK